MFELRDLYQEMILEHGRHPRCCYAMAHANRQARGVNPFCGDKLTLYLDIEYPIIKTLSFTGSGCAISMASASLLSETLRGRTEEEANLFFDFFHKLLTSEQEPTLSIPGHEKLAIFANVKHFPIRVKCATLAWHTLRAALTQTQGPVSTED